MADSVNNIENILIDNLNNTDADNLEIEKASKNVFSFRDKLIVKILAVADAILFVFCGCYIYFSGGAREFRALKNEGSVFGATSSYYDNSVVLSDLSVTTKDTQYPEGMQSKFRQLYSVNEDTVAWVKAINTSIDFVVMQSSDNDKYLRRDFYHNYSIRGTVFMDYRDTVGRDWNSLAKNTILYGHNFSEGSQMIFEDIQKYSDIEYYKEHPIILMDTLYNSYKWKVLGTFEIYPPDANSPELFYYWCAHFTDSNTVAFANEVILRSFVVNPSVDVLPTDKFLTLSTCKHMQSTSGEVVGRYILVARLVREDENPTVNIDTAYQNVNNRMPQIYYDYNGLTNPYADTPIWQYNN